MHTVDELMKLATQMMRDSWATGNDASWQPAYQALRSALESALKPQEGLPREPPPGLLMSMAIRYDHGLGVPGYYDQPMMVAANHGMTHAKHLEGTLRVMRQLYEEVSGFGFYSPDRERDYAALSAAPQHPGKEG